MADNVLNLMVQDELFPETFCTYLSTIKVIYKYVMVQKYE